MSGDRNLGDYIDDPLDDEGATHVWEQVTLHPPIELDSSNSM